MRVLLAVALVLVILGTVQAYLMFQAGLPSQSAAALAPVAVAGDYALELTLTFAAAPDSFASEPAAVVVRLAGREVLRRSEPIAAGTTLRIAPVPGLAAGSNEFWVEATAGDDAEPVVHAVRVRLFRDDRVCGEGSLWSEPGEPVQGTLTVELPAKE